MCQEGRYREGRALRERGKLGGKAGKEGREDGRKGGREGG